MEEGWRGAAGELCFGAAKLICGVFVDLADELRGGSVVVCTGVPTELGEGFPH